MATRASGEADQAPSATAILCDHHVASPHSVGFCRDFLKFRDNRVETLGFWPIFGQSQLEGYAIPKSRIGPSLPNTERKCHSMPYASTPFPIHAKHIGYTKPFNHRREVGRPVMVRGGYGGSAEAAWIRVAAAKAGTAFPSPTQRRVKVRPTPG